MLNPGSEMERIRIWVISRIRNTDRYLENVYGYRGYRYRT
jgi:hypothetical protein